MELQIILISIGLIVVCIIMRRMIEHIKEILENDIRTAHLTTKLLEETKELLKTDFEKEKSGTKA